MNNRAQVRDFLTTRRARIAADMIVANLRTAAGKDPRDKGLHDLVGGLSTRSDDFRRRWGAHNVRIHGAGVKHFHHHAVGAPSPSPTRASTCAANPTSPSPSTPPNPTAHRSSR